MSEVKTDLSSYRGYETGPRGHIETVFHYRAGVMQMGAVNGGAKLVHPGGAKLVHLTLCGPRCWGGGVPVVHRRDPRCFV